MYLVCLWPEFNYSPVQIAVINQAINKVLKAVRFFL